VRLTSAAGALGEKANLNNATSFEAAVACGYQAVRAQQWDAAAAAYARALELAGSASDQ